MDFLTNFPAFILLLGVIIFVHEAGHLLMAKAFNVKVLAFSLGFGKRLWGFEHGETEYRISLLPLGGYVRLGGEDPDEASDDPRDFLNKPRWQRILVYLAGPVMNVVLSVLVVAILFMVGTDVAAGGGSVEPRVSLVLPDSPAATAGLEPGDMILELEGEEMDSWQDFAVRVSVSPEEPLAVLAERNGETFTTTLTPEAVEGYGYGDAGVYPEAKPVISSMNPGTPAMEAGFEVGDELLTIDGRPVASVESFIEYLKAHPEEPVRVGVNRGGERTQVTVTPESVDGVGRIGAAIGISFGSVQRYPVGEAFVQSLRFNWDLTVRTLDILGKILTGQVKAQNAVSGPIDILSLSGQAARAGADKFVYMLAVISLSIAIFNLLPIPLLDGGQILILLIESVLGRDLSLNVKIWVQNVGFVLIILLMVSVIFLDISKRLPEGLFGGG